MEEIKNLVASCGMDCRLCAGYLALKNDVKSEGIRIPYCQGCRIRGKQCAFLKKKCALLIQNKVTYCYECDDFPCDPLKTIDKRYRARYRMSLIDNLEQIRDEGIDRFIKSQNEKWKCPDCGEMISCHNGICFSCSPERLRGKKKIYRWEENKQDLADHSGKQEGE